jgi:hypothetical protein
MTDRVLPSGRARVQAAVAVRFELSLPRRVWYRPGTLSPRAEGLQAANVRPMTPE